MSRALLVGIDGYSWSPLEGCINDVHNMEEVLSRNHNNSLNFTCRTLTSDHQNITEAVLRKNLNELLAEETGMALFYFAGHGAEDKLGGFLVTQDAEKYDQGLRLSELIELVNAAQHIGEILIILDCCHAGHAGDIASLNHGAAIMRKGVSILTASSKTGNASEIDGRGVFTSIVVDALNGGAADIMGKVTSASIYNYVDRLLGPWDQRPVLKTHVSELKQIRQCKPKLEIDEIMEIISLFKDPDEEHLLSPEYEDTTDVAVPEKVKMFKMLQKYTAASLVEPVGEAHMYWAAMNSKSCRLTLSGKFYWKRVKSGKV